MAPVSPEGSQEPVRTATEAAQAPPPAGERFPRSSRLIKGSEFRAVLSRGRRVTGDFLVVHLLATGLASSRLGLAVPRAVGNAVRRNRLKRRLRELFRRRFRRELDETPGPCDLVIRGRPGAGERSQAELETEIASLIEHWRRKPRGRARRKDKPSP